MSGSAEELGAGGDRVVPTAAPGPAARIGRMTSPPPTVCALGFVALCSIVTGTSYTPGLD